MSRIKNFMNNIVYNLKETITRFPMTIVFLSSLSTVMFLIIEDYSFGYRFIIEIYVCRYFWCVFGNNGSIYDGKI